MADIRVQRVESSASEQRDKLRRLYAIVAYHYPQYTLVDAENLPARDLNLLIKTARQQDARKMMNLIHIVSSPHAKDKNATKNLLEHFRKLAED